MSHFKLTLTILLLAAVLFFLNVFRALATPNNPAPESPETLEVAPDEITIIGSPLSIGLGSKNPAGNYSQISSQEIDFVSSATPSALLNRLAGVNIQKGSGQEHLTAIRSPVLTGGAGAGSFLYLEDGVSLRSAPFANVNGLLDAITELAGEIDIVRGPGSALYGTNALHGLINIQTAKPQAIFQNASTVIFGVEPFSSRLIISQSARRHQKGQCG